ncbi:G:T-mismatch repair DNA endonuclease (very short patch repair protein) [Agromyces sp. PvR057]
MRVDDGFVRPDIVFTRRRIAVFIDGCFWHSCPLHGGSPSVNTSYWAPKFERTRERDQDANKLLIGAGWQVVRIWEHVPVHAAADALEHTFDHSGHNRREGCDSPGSLTVIE